MIRIKEIPTLLDFSHCGYGGGGVALPIAPVLARVPSMAGDATAAIQAALDEVGRCPAMPNGMRGAVQLDCGTYSISGNLRLRQSGVVLRGAGMGNGGTVLAAEGASRRTLILCGPDFESRPPRPCVAGESDRLEKRAFPAYLPPLPRKAAGGGCQNENCRPPTPALTAIRCAAAGAMTLAVENPGALAPGDRVKIRRPSTAAWIKALGMDAFEGHYQRIFLDWAPGSRDLEWDRLVTSVADGTIGLDAPITCALSEEFGGGWLLPGGGDGRLRQLGVEHLACVSRYESGLLTDEEHAWIAIHCDEVEDSWIRNVTTRHFAGGAVRLGSHTRRMTVMDCAALEPVSEIAAQRRISFYAGGQQALFVRCRSEQAYHDFAVGHCSAGPTVFLECEAKSSHHYSGPIESWACGALYDNVSVQGHGLWLTNVGDRAQGAGWTAAECGLWRCSANEVRCHNPPGAINWAAECVGAQIGDGVRATLPPDAPLSLYRAQLEQRLGRDALQALDADEWRETNEVGNPESSIDNRQVKRQGHACNRRDDGCHLTDKPTLAAVEHGWFTIDGRPVWGEGSMGTNIWQAHWAPVMAEQYGRNLMQWMPGRSGPYAVEDMDELTDEMIARHRPLFTHRFGLWYDRRRALHDTVRRADADVWPPFLENPWARSGRGQAWDGLSRYDLTRFNSWYFERMAKFAGLCETKGLIFHYGCYNEHALLENDAHYVDFPWRPVNCLQETGMPDRVPAANAFYDIYHPVRADLHRRYLRHVLDVLGGFGNAILGCAYSGPPGFIQFWLDEIAAWRQNHVFKAKVALLCTKDVMDAILADPARAPSINIIETQLWWHMDDGELYALPGGKDLSRRLDTIARFGKDRHKRCATTPDQAYRHVREYRDRYPDKVIIAPGRCKTAWPVFMAGGCRFSGGEGGNNCFMFGDSTDGSDAVISRLVERWGRRLVGAQPNDRAVKEPRGAWCLADPGRLYLVYVREPHSQRLVVDGLQGTFDYEWVSSRTGQTLAQDSVTANGVLDISAPGGDACVLIMNRTSTDAACAT